MVSPLPEALCGKDSDSDFDRGCCVGYSLLQESGEVETIILVEGLKISVVMDVKDSTLIFPKK
jgi:hypothetical protein